jgi:beta-lactamase class D
MLKILFSFLCSILFVTSLQAIDFKEDKNIKKLFDDEKITGTFVIYDTQKKILVGYNKKRAETLYTPASTFKIFNALIGLDSGSVKNVDEIIFIYDGNSDMFLENWKQDTSIRSGMKISHLPAFQELARRIGMEKMQAGINKLNYGNKNLGKKVDEFWLESLKISPIQQTELLDSLAKQELPFSKKAQTDVKEVMFLDNINGWDIYGKTGWATRGYEPSIGWFVGWVERDGKIYSFVLNMNMNDESYISKRVPLAKKALEAYGLLKK